MSGHVRSYPLAHHTLSTKPPMLRLKHERHTLLALTETNFGSSPIGEREPWMSTPPRKCYTDETIYTSTEPTRTTSSPVPPKETTRRPTLTETLSRTSPFEPWPARSLPLPIRPRIGSHQAPEDACTHPTTPPRGPAQKKKKDGSFHYDVIGIAFALQYNNMERCSLWSDPCVSAEEVRHRIATTTRGVKRNPRLETTITLMHTPSMPYRVEPLLDCTSKKHPLGQAKDK